jgi:hypothetical protein
VPTVAPDRTQRGMDFADGDIGAVRNALCAPTEGDFIAALRWWRHQGCTAPRSLEGGTQSRSTRRSRTGASSEVATPRTPSVMKGRLAAGTLKEVATPPDAWLWDRGSDQVCFVDAAFGRTKGCQVTVTVTCYRASANSASAGRVVVRSPPPLRTLRIFEGSSADGDIGGDHSVKPVCSYQGLHGNEWWHASGVVL